MLKTEVISLSKDDINKCIELDRLSFKGFWNKNQWESELSSPFGICIGIIHKSQIIALASGSIVNEKLDITFIAVHPNFRRQGLGKEIISCLLKKSKEKKVKNVILEVRADNYAAVNLYKKLSFKLINKRKKYYKDGTDAMVFSIDN